MLKMIQANNAGTKSHSTNWSDAEIHWKDHHHNSKRHNTAVWESIVKQLNSLLREQGIMTTRTASQCKSKIKNLEGEYKCVKDHNNKNRNNRETFTYYEDLNEITPKAVIEYRFEDDGLPINISLSCSVRNLPLQCQKQRKSYQTPVSETKRVNCLRMHFLGVNWLPPTKGRKLWLVR